VWPEADGARERLLGEEVGQAFVNFALFLARMQFGAAQDADAGAIVAAILEAAQASRMTGAACFLPT